jgi:hypothetical protein
VLYQPGPSYTRLAYPKVGSTLPTPRNSQRKRCSSSGGPSVSTGPTLIVVAGGGGSRSIRCRTYRRTNLENALFGIARYM